jgi:hypothetical protein
MRSLRTILTIALLLAAIAIPLPKPAGSHWVARGPRIALFRRDDPNRPYVVYGITGVAGLAMLVGLAKMYLLFRRWQIDSQRDREPWEQRH